MPGNDNNLCVAVMPAAFHHNKTPSCDYEMLAELCCGRRIRQAEYGLRAANGGMVVTDRSTTLAGSTQPKTQRTPPMMMMMMMGNGSN
jgi:hypothetical protein